MTLCSLCPFSSKAALHADINAIQCTVIPMGRLRTSEKQSRCTNVPKESLSAEATHHMRLCRVAGGVGVCWDVYVVDWSEKHHGHTCGSPTISPVLYLHYITFTTLTEEGTSLNWGNKAPLVKQGPYCISPSGRKPEGAQCLLLQARQTAPRNSRKIYD